MSRQDFNDTWLAEAPMKNNVDDMYPIITHNINDILVNGIAPTHLSNNLLKLDLSNTVYYWYGTLSKVILGIELDKKPQSLVVNIVGKDPAYTGKPTYASDLYNAILKDNQLSICITSDNQLSDEGFNIWKKLVNQGHAVSVYDVHNPGQSRVTLKSAKDLDQYFGSDTSFKNYRFVLSESTPTKLCEVIAYFNTRRLRELSNIL